MIYVLATVGTIEGIEGIDYAYSKFTTITTDYT